MADAVLTLKMNPHTGERTLTIHYESEPDALSYEHEDDHRAFVESLLGQPLSEVADRLVVKRAPPHPGWPWSRDRPPSSPRPAAACV